MTWRYWFPKKKAVAARAMVRAPAGVMLHCILTLNCDSDNVLLMQNDTERASASRATSGSQACNGGEMVTENRAAEEEELRARAAKTNGTARGEKD